MLKALFQRVGVSKPGFISARLLMNVESSKSPMAGWEINETKFLCLGAGKLDLCCGAVGLRAAPSPDLR